MLWVFLTRRNQNAGQQESIQAGHGDWQIRHPRDDPVIAFGPTGEEHLRLSFCVSEEEINKAFDRMEAFLA